MKTIGIGNFTVLGDLNVGKTKILDTINNNKSFNTEYTPTIGVNFQSIKRKIHDYTIVIKLWEFTGNRDYSYLIREINKDYNGDNGILIIYDVTNRESFDNLPTWIDIARVRVKNHGLIIIVGNKCDNEEKRKVKNEEAQEYADSLNIKFIEVSALNNMNIESLVDIIVMYGLNLVIDSKCNEEKYINEKINVIDKKDKKTKWFNSLCMLL